MLFTDKSRPLSISLTLQNLKKYFFCEDDFQQARLFILPKSYQLHVEPGTVEYE